MFGFVLQQLFRGKEKDLSFEIANPLCTSCLRVHDAAAHVCLLRPKSFSSLKRVRFCRLLQQQYVCCRSTAAAAAAARSSRINALLAGNLACTKLFFPPMGSFCPTASRAQDFVPWVAGAGTCPIFYLKKISGSFSQLLSAETSGHPLLHPRHERCPNSRARDLDLASASSGVFNNSSHLDFGHPFSRTDGRHACAIAAPLVTVGFAVPTFRVSWPLNRVFSSFRI